MDVNRAVYNLDSLSDNLRAIRGKLRPGINVIAALKGNAYGHGAVAVARRLAHEGVDTIMTGSLEEAYAIRSAGIELTTIMFAITPPDGIAEIIGDGFIPTIIDDAGALAASGAAATASDVFVKLDMGLGRLGITEDSVETYLESLKTMPGLRVAGLYTHLPFATESGREWAKERYAAFDQLLGRLGRKGLLPKVIQAGASSSVAAGLNDAANAVCVGHLLFGLSPLDGLELGDMDALQPVFCELRSRLVQAVDRPQGSDITIAGVHDIPQGKRIGVAPIGTAHGLKRPSPGKAAFALAGKHKVPILSVSLEHLTLDLDTAPNVRAGDDVVLLGHQGDERITLAEMAGWFGLSQLEIISAIYGRVLPVYVGGGI